MKKNKVIGLAIVHYGSEFLATAISAIYPLVDEIIISYTPQPSHGTAAPTGTICPDAEADLMIQAYCNDVDLKVVWDTNVFTNEGQHRDYAMSLCKKIGADVVVVFDSDEVYIENELNTLINECLTKKCNIKIRMAHLYKSFNEILHDTDRQDRIFYVGKESKGETVISNVLSCYHFGYCQKNETINYKISIHGHLSEWRKDIDWFNEKYVNYKKGDADTHPVIKNFWKPEPFDKELLPEILKKHPYFNLEIVN